MTQPWEDHPKTRDMLKYLVVHDARPWGCLKDLTTPDAVLQQLRAYPAVKIPDLCNPLIDVYHSRYLGRAYVGRVCVKTLQNAVQTQQISSETLVYLRYLHGNLRAFICAKELPETIAITLDVHFYVSVKEQYMLTAIPGPHCFHHALYLYHHLHGRITTLDKLLQTKRFSWVDVSSTDPSLAAEDEGIPY